MADEPRQMTEVLRIRAGTKMAKGPDGKWFFVDDDDPRATAFLAADDIRIDGVLQPSEMDMEAMHANGCAPWYVVPIKDDPLYRPWGAPPLKRD